ncbi:MAG: YwaF family protein, partial [Clostridia bacterium]|nr:YwaF family protein [Clostridia bacterium]
VARTIPGELDGLNALDSERVSFWINHWAAFFMPILLVALKLFKRPKFKEWAFAVGEFCIYFFAILFVNAWLSNYGSCDFFYLNSDFVASNLGKWAEDTQKIVFSFQYKDLTFTFMPLYQALFFAVYLALTVGVWFLYALLFSTWDAAQDRRERERAYRMMKKSMKEFLNGHNINEPLSGDASPRLVLKHFCKRYGNSNYYSVHDVSFEVKGGEIFGFLGPNGAGKSTIIKSIVGIQPLSEGAIEICGYDSEKQAVQAKLQIGYVPDHYALYENLTGREYINYIADLFRVDKKARDARIQKYVERFELVESFDNQMKTYSHGMKQKITIMAALVHNPKVWILDEPLTGLDPTSIHEVKECMKEHAAAGNIVFFSSHIIDVVEKICDRIAIIAKGQLCACTRVSDLDEAGVELEQFYLSSTAAANDEHIPYEKGAEHEHQPTLEEAQPAVEENQPEEATV